MSKVEQLAEKLNPIAGRVSNSSFVKTIMGGMMAAFPAVMTGSFASIFNGIPFEAYQKFLQTTRLSTVFSTIVLCTTTLIALYIAFGVAFVFAKEKGQDAMSSGIIALVSFLAITPFAATPTEYGTVNYSIPTDWLGGKGMICALIVGFIAGAMFVFIKKRGWTIKLPDSVPAVISSSFAGIIPGVLIICFFAIVADIFAATEFGSLHQAVYSLIQTPLQGFGSNIWTVLIIVMVSQSLWLIGIHGPMLVIPIAGMVWTMADYANLAAYNAGQPLPNITGMAFYMVYSFAGGGLGLAICMMFAKSKRYKALGKMALIPSIFGITEPLIFGTPIVMNFKMAIPHIFVPTISIAFAYIVTKIGIIPSMSGASLPSATPIGMMGLMEGSWKIGLFQLLLVFFWIIAYYPFFKSIDKDALKDEAAEA